MRRVSWFAKPRPLTYEYALVCAARWVLRCGVNGMILYA